MFNVGLAYEKAEPLQKTAEIYQPFLSLEAIWLGELATEAVAAVRDYQCVAPEGITAIEARQKQAELETLALGLAPSQDVCITTTTTPAPNQTESGGSWLRLGIGVGAIAAGLALEAGWLLWPTRDDS